ncbi:uncharacterized protein EV420DRAFT_1638625 [Desarmillaria tabescens]|uniref:DUF221-domain-containing protein n=1 Tax=Armillaria tabescens TaxID=1929756 RepID=A0AA39NDN2_ARMTA|nr:uncharacterized protein EV420DRAFT_1638625 [Desarmillaria tabescens]KAK0463700.1 hypothetical protein EV420DRAFT_1638625 [Desarmillaria tabescens]
MFNGTEPGGPPPGSPPTMKYEGPWFTTQLVLSGSIGLWAFLIFSYCRTRWPLYFAPRTKLKGFSPHEAHTHPAFFGWILPTIRTSEFTVLQIVGLDAAVLLNFYKMSFYLFSICSLFAIGILMPINWKHNKDLGDAEDWPDEGEDWSGDDYNNDWPSLLRTSFATTFNATFPTQPGSDWLDLLTDASTYLSIHLVFTYLFTLLALYLTYKNYRRFIRSRQLFSLELVHSIPARTVMITNLPSHLQGERALAEYFENMSLAVESVTVCREVGALKKLLDKRTAALLALERAWAAYVGNPSSVEAYDPEETVMPLVDVDVEAPQALPTRLVVPHRKRPTLRLGWFKPKVDALEYLETRFKELDEQVKKKRRTGRFKATQAAFVTFEKMSSAVSAFSNSRRRRSDRQALRFNHNVRVNICELSITRQLENIAYEHLKWIASTLALQVVHANNPWQCTTYAAPEPRDIVWSNMTPSQAHIRTRDALVLGALALLFFFWFFPITALASLLSYDEIKRTLPWLGRLIDSNAKVQAVVQNSLPSVAMITLNALLPFLLEGLTYLQGYRARSWIEYSLLKKYFLFLLINVVFIFLLATTYWQLVRDLANYPAKIPEKLAKALQSGKARNFFLSYVILQGLGIMPLQLLNLGIIVPRFILRLFVTRTPRDFAELNAPPMINYGVVYPQAILIFTITILYSVVQPLIVIFGSVYFGVAYVVYKYKLLFVFYKPYESQGQAWPLTFVRLIWGVVIFLVFMTGFFILSKSFVMASLLTPLLVGTVVWSWWVDKSLKPLSEFVSLSSVYEVERGEETADVVRLRAGHPVTWSQSNLNRRRYAQNDDTLYVAPEDERTDYSQPPMANWYSGVLNTGKRRYGHPALNGVLPEPWLPLKKGQTLVNGDRSITHRQSRDSNQAVVLTLRKKPSKVRRTKASNPPTEEPYVDGVPGPSDSGVSSNRWEDTQAPPARRVQTEPVPLSHRLSYDQASGVIMLPDDDHWMGDEIDSDEEDYGAVTGDSTPPGAMSETVARSQPVPMSPGRSRYGTYFHHPERRRQPIPGAFPRS